MGPTKGVTDYLKGLTVALQHGAYGDTAQPPHTSGPTNAHLYWELPGLAAAL